MKLNLSTQALARGSGRRPKLTIMVWIAFLGLAIGLINTLLADGLTTEFGFTNNPESQRADTLLEERLRGPKRANELVIVRSDTLTVDDPAFQAQVEELYDQFLALGSDVIAVSTHFYQSGDESLVSADRQITILPITMAGLFDDATTNIEQVLDIVHETNGQNGFDVLATGEATVAFETNEASESDLLKGEAIGIPVALIILVLLFGALLAALTPVVVALFSITVALGVTALIGQAFELSFFVTNMIFMIGLAVGIDYSLFIVSRYREERGKGLEKLDAIARAGETATRAVFFSGMTVVLALFGMLIIPTTIFQSLATGAILVVIASVLASLTLLPAVLSVMGDKVNSLRVPIIGRRLDEQADDQSGGFWNWITRTVMKRPIISLVLSAGLLIAAAIPFLDMNTGFNGVSTLPDGLQSKEAFLILEDEFSFGLITPAEIVIDGDINSEPVQAAIQSLLSALEDDPAFVVATQPQINPSGDLALLAVPVLGDPGGEAAIDAIGRLRDQHIPGAFSQTQADVLVTGATAFNIDFFEITDRFTPIVFAVVLGLSFILLMIVFRSIVVPVKAMIMNLLSVGAAYGLMVLVFQKGVGADILGFQQTEIIDAWIPLFLFTVLFGLSTDYHVFLLSRIRERYDQTHDNAGSVAFGLRSTAGLITRAALIMVAVFGGFAIGDLVMFQQVGFGLAVAVFLDATIVRSILVPASMRLLGNANWYFPSVLRWLPDVRVEGGEASTPSQANPSVAD